MNVTQLDLFSALRGPKIVLPIDPDGHVVHGNIDEVLTLPHRGLAWNRADIELHRHVDGRWMWSTSFHIEDRGGGYRVGPKWGKFAETRDDALFYAIEELSSRLDGYDTKDARDIRAWMAAL